MEENEKSLTRELDRYDYAETVAKMGGNLVQAAAWHCYAGNDPNGWAPMTRYHNQFPNLEQYMTECWTATGTTDWLHTSNFNLMPLQNWANGIIAWTLGSWTGGGPALSGGDACAQCTGMITVDPNSGSYTKTIDYYMMGQFSKYIPKGARVVDGTGSYLFPDGSGMESVATVNPDGSRTVVIQNRYGKDIWVELGTQTDGGRTWNGRVKAKSVTTWILPKA